jgi:hypothetical protein
LRCWSPLHSLAGYRKRRSPSTGDRDSLAPARFGDGACAAATIERASCSATLIWRRGAPRSSAAAIRTIVNEALSALEREFAGLYSPIGRPSIPPEKLLRAMLLQPPMNRPGRKPSAGPKPRAFVLVPKKGARFRITKAASVGGLLHDSFDNGARGAWSSMLSAISSQIDANASSSVSMGPFADS